MVYLNDGLHEVYCIIACILGSWPLYRYSDSYYYYHYQYSFEAPLKGELIITISTVLYTAPQSKTSKLTAPNPHLCRALAVPASHVHHDRMLHQLRSLNASRPGR